MRCEIWDTVTARMIHIDEGVTPVCGEDFCDNCGDCLACADAGEPCPVIGACGGHRWIRYITSLGEKPATLDREAG